MNTPQRAYAKRLRIIGQAIPGEDIRPLAIEVLRRIVDIRRRMQCGAYVLADDKGNVYILSDEAGTTRALLAEHGSMLVGCYAAVKPFNTPVEQLVGDLIAYFVEVGYVTKQMIREAIRAEEG